MTLDIIDIIEITNITGLGKTILYKYEQNDKNFPKRVMVSGTYNWRIYYKEDIVNWYNNYYLQNKYENKKSNLIDSILESSCI